MLPRRASREALFFVAWEDEYSTGENAGLAGADAATALAAGDDALAMLRRAQIVGNLYPAAQSVMDAGAAQGFEDVKR